MIETRFTAPADDTDSPISRYAKESLINEFAARYWQIRDESDRRDILPAAFAAFDAKAEALLIVISFACSEWDIKRPPSLSDVSQLAQGE